MLYSRLIQLLKKKGWEVKADVVKEVVDKGINSYATTIILTTHDQL